MVKLPPAEQARLLAPAMFMPAGGAWGRGGATLVRLRAADPTRIRRALLVAWRERAPATVIEAAGAIDAD